jgi:tyrosinase
VWIFDLNAEQQLIVEQAHMLADSFPSGAERDRYVTAAATLRLPYWDWAKVPSVGGHVMPDSLSKPTISVQTPKGQDEIDNPLYSYKFHPIDPNFSQPVGTE